jgi:DNA-directed RNA polymerase sigma subunit (sigma70/sigma32)
MTPEDRDALVLEHMGLATWMAKKVRSVSRLARQLPWEDARQAAMLGLVRASRSFDPAICPRFAGFASWAIRTEVQQAARRASVVTVPSPLVQGAASFMRPGTQAAAYAAAQACVSLDAVTALMEAPTAPGGRPTEVDVAPLLARLRPRDRQVVLRRLEGQSLREVGKELGISHERARQIEAAALARLRELVGGAAALA